MFAIFFSACLSYFIAFEYQTMGEKTFATVMFFFGFFLGSLHHLINITCSADLGRQVQGKRATATITGIIDALGNCGIALSNLILGITIKNLGWFNGYMMIIGSVIVLAMFPLGPVFCSEITEIREIRETQSMQSEMSNSTFNNRRSLRSLSHNR